MNSSVIPTNGMTQSDYATGMLGWAERGWLPDVLVRHGIRRMCKQRLAAEIGSGIEDVATRFQRGIDALRDSPIAIHTDAANRQHYELPPAFFAHCLGSRLKYSACYYRNGDESLNQAETAMLELYGERAELADDQDILELGCGWGSLTLWMAQRYPSARITAVSNSAPQREYIEAQCRQRGLRNVRILTEDANRLQLAPGSFDRCVSVEMFEHMRNYETLMARVAAWLRPCGKLFVHIFCHRSLMYPFETAGQDNWMGRHFFTGGLMPSTATLLWFQRDLWVEQAWQLDGRHYQKTADHWLARQDANREAIIPILRDAYGDEASLWFQRWRMFWMSCAEMFGYANGQEWLVAHYRFARVDD